ncbi:hypothetical protein NL676_007666 [Syzygium grande]|nr:hypothetical protein NL676_007666 [Syzygium grande]
MNRTMDLGKRDSSQQETHRRRGNRQRGNAKEGAGRRLSDGEDGGDWSGKRQNECVRPGERTPNCVSL